MHEKYLALARDAASSGDRVMAENLLQHADHYYRILNEAAEASREHRSPNGHARPQVNGQGSDSKVEGGNTVNGKANNEAGAEETVESGEATVKKPGEEIAEAAAQAQESEASEDTDAQRAD